MIDQRVVEAIGFVPHGLESSLDLLFDLVIIFDILELDLTFFNQGELKCGVKIIDKLSQIVSTENVMYHQMRLTPCMALGTILKWVGMSLLNTPASKASTWPPTYVSDARRWPS